MVEEVDQFKNPFAQFGYVVVNVLAGDVSDEDVRLFFGPIHPKDIFVRVPPHWHMAKVFKHVGIFSSTKEAERKGGWGTKAIPDGFTDVMNIGRARHRVTIFRPSDTGKGE